MAEDKFKEVADKLRWYNKLEPIIAKLKRLSEKDLYLTLSTILANYDKLIPEELTEESFTVDTGTLFDTDFGPEFKLIVMGEKFPGLNTFKLKSYLTGKERKISGTMMRERAVAMGGLICQHDGQMIQRNQENIRVDIRKKYFVPLMATLYRHVETNKVFFPCLSRNTDTGIWYMTLQPIDSEEFSEFGRFIIPTK